MSVPLPIDLMPQSILVHTQLLSCFILLCNSPAPLQMSNKTIILMPPVHTVILLCIVS